MKFQHATRILQSNEEISLLSKTKDKININENGGKSGKTKTEINKSNKESSE